MEHFIEHFAFLEPERSLSNAFAGQYDFVLVVLSILVAIMAAYTAFQLSERINASENSARRLVWLVAGALALGGGIWSMHFIGMLAYSLPVKISYDAAITLISMLPALFVSFVVLYCRRNRRHTLLKLAMRSVLMGGGIGAMHYTGMIAMCMPAVMRYDSKLFTLSIVVAIMLAFMALAIKRWADQAAEGKISQNRAILLASVVMGTAISGMHYTGMAAVYYFPAVHSVSAETVSWQADAMGLLIALVMSGVLILLVMSVFVSRRLELTANLQASEARLQTLFDTVVDGIITVDENGFIESINSATETIFGYPAKEIVGQSINRLMPKQFGDQYDDHMQYFMQTGQAKISDRVRELQGLRKDGSEFAMEVAINTTLVRGQHMFVGSVRDITARKKAEDALHCAQIDSQRALAELAEKERVMRLALSGAGAGYFNYKPLSGALSWDERALEIYGISAEEFDGLYSDWVSRIHPRDVAVSTGIFQAALSDRNRNTLDLEYRILCPDGEVRYLSVTGFIERDDAGKAVNVHGLYFDYTERRLIEQELYTAKETAEKANKAKSEFLATMSHEIRTPLNGVLGMLHLLRKTRLENRQQHYVDTAMGSSEMLLTVINDILDFSKLEAGKLELESIPFNPVRLVEDTAALLANGAHERGLELICSVQPNLPAMVKGDPTRLRQVLTNLVSNAIKFTEQGQVVLYATALDDDILFGVVDTGIGMSDAQQQAVFNAFTQADSSHTRKYGGTGLGLAISERLVTEMGGQLRVTSVPGLGSDFNFQLALGVIDNLLLCEQVSGLLQKQRVLLVDDNDTNLEVLSCTLQSWQVAHIGKAKNGIDALQQLRAAAEAGQAYTIALLDMQMPHMTGIELARAIRVESSLTDMQLVMLSSLDRDESAPELDAWLTKPARQSELYNTLLLLLGEAVQPPVVESLVPQEGKWWFDHKAILLVEDNLTNQEVAREVLLDVGFDIDICDNGKAALSAVQ